MPPPDQFEHYRLVIGDDGLPLELGRGAMGVTYKAFDVNLQCHVALKVINAARLNDPISADRFLREARSAAQLRHAHVASVFHLGRQGDSYFYAMEFIDGETVEARIRREGPLTIRLALLIADQVASALVAAEKQQLVHRDIKPANVMLAHNGEGEVAAKLIDFGLVKSTGFGVDAGLTGTGFIGTPYFASPEQLNELTQDIRSDLYSLGVTLWFMLTGKPTFSGSIASVIAQHLNSAPPYRTLQNLPSTVVALLSSLLEKDPSRRVQSPSQLRLQIRRCLESLTEAETAPPIEVATPAVPPMLVPRTQPSVGTLLLGRYELTEDLDPQSTVKVFKAKDLERQTWVRLKLVSCDPQTAADLKGDAEMLNGIFHPGLLRVIDVAPLPSPWERFVLIALEWCDGISLQAHVRARGKLTLSEIGDLLEQISAPLDLSHALGVNLGLEPREVFLVTPQDGSGKAVSSLRSGDRPTTVLKMNPLGRAEDIESFATWVGGQTQNGLPSTRTDLAGLGELVLLLMGNTAGGRPATVLSPLEHEVVQLARTAGTQCASAEDFLKRFRTLINREPSPAQAARSTTGEKTRAQTPRLKWAIVGLGFAVVAGGIWFYSRSPLPRGTNTVDSGIAQLPARAAPTRSRTPSPEIGKAWTNSLGMPFMPLGKAHLGVFKVRVREFSAFVETTRYDAEGGMYSWQHDGFKEHGHSWKQPGFSQTPDHAVVGVSWEDANKFCEWLTQKERAEGTLSPNQGYRLPTDREWDVAVGLPEESGTVPEERSGKVKGVYPWGNVYPPPSDHFNYAGSESKVDVPDNWSSLPNYRDPFPRTRPSFGLAPNAHGFCDLGGDAWEWCDDRYNTRMNWRVLRGGSWATSRPEEMLSSFRQKYDPTFRHDDVGFRCILANVSDKR